MPTQFIDTNSLPRTKTPQGEQVEVLNGALVGAKNVLGTVRYLDGGQTYKADASPKHQLLYLMDGKAKITLDDKAYDVEKGAGVYLAPAEGASITAASGSKAKLFHLEVPQIPR